MTYKVVYNASFGGFDLSGKAQAEYHRLAGKRFSDYIVRHDPHLVAVVEQLGGAANGPCAELRIMELPGHLYRIQENRGSETVITPDTRWEWLDAREV